MVNPDHSLSLNLSGKPARERRHFRYVPFGRSPGVFLTGYPLVMLVPHFGQLF